MRKHIFSVLKEGKGGEVFLRLLNDTQKYIKPHNGNPLKNTHFKESYRILNGFLIDLRFALSFLREDYESSFAIPSRHIDKFSLPGDILTKERTREMQSYFRHVFKAHYDTEFREQLKYFSEIEIARLDEAVVNLQSGAYFSCIIMCVSAVEARLHALVKVKKPRLYEKEKLSDATLGKLLYEISSNQKFSFIRKDLPKRYFHFFDFCNKYRIFSAHPKEISINYQDALSIFSLSMAILVGRNNE